MKSVWGGLFICALGLLTACTPPEPVDFSQNNVAISQNKIPCKLQSIAVSVESDANFGGGNYGARPPSLDKFRDPMKSALEDGLDRAAVFDYNSQSSCAVEAKILGIKSEDFGITFPANLYVSYEINSLDSGQPLLSSIVVGHGETPPMYNFLGIVRSRHSLILSGQDAVRGMIDTTEQFAAAKAMPANNGPQS